MFFFLASMPKCYNKMFSDEAMLKHNSLFVVIPALNEEHNVGPTVETVRAAVQNYFAEVTIAVFNDGSSDRTGEMAEELARKFDNVRAIHHDKPKGLGYVYKAGIKLSDCEYVILVPGDNEGLQESLATIFGYAGKTDIVIPHTSNPEVRPLSRQIISKLFVMVLNALFGLRLKYYNGCVLHKTEIINSIDIRTDSFAYQAEALIKLIKQGYRYVEVGAPIQERPSGGSKAFRWRNIVTVSTTILDLVWEIYFTSKPRAEKVNAR